MLATTITAVLGITLVVCGWLTVQVAWQRVFANSIAGDEPVFDRCGCHSCGRSACDKSASAEKYRFQQARHNEQPTHQEV